MARWYRPNGDLSARDIAAQSIDLLMNGLGKTRTSGEDHDTQSQGQPNGQSDRHPIGPSGADGPRS
ncbi:hypothetical protein ACCD06_21635 [Azospirillum sp. CT11-132]|uniref:hypothetical protein n=1 Tax=Azospirillum sp. CT11-132 TaxID=3396317 RepID=UPI0039A659A2